MSAGQSLIPANPLDRVNGVYRFLGGGAIPLGACAGGILDNVAGLRTAFIAGGVFQLVIAAIAASTLIRSTGALRDGD